MTRAKWKLLCLFSAFVVLSSNLIGDDAVLVRFGRMNAVVVVTEQLLASEGPYAVRPAARYLDERRFIDRAVAELAEHLGLLCSLLDEGELEVVHVPASDAAKLAAERTAEGRAVIMLGGPELDGALYKSLSERSEDPEAFVLRVQDGVATILGPTPKAVLNGTYELLEQIGFRWYMPGDFGRVIPGGFTHAVRAQETIQSPSFRIRYTLRAGRHRARHSTPEQPMEKDWPYRMRHSDIERLSVGHGTAGGPNRRRHFEEHPEWFALLDGERRGHQLCLSNPEVLDMVVEYNREQFQENPDERVLRVSPHDGYGYCECGDCLALDTPGLIVGQQQPMPSMTDRYVWFINEAIDRLVDEFPDMRVPFMAYAGVQDPPVRYNLDTRVPWYIAVTPIVQCRMHNPGNPVCPDARYTIWLTEQWAKQNPEMILNLGYHWNLACPGFPFMMISRIRGESEVFHQLGSDGVSRVTGIQHSHWSNFGPSYYLAAKLAWDVEADADALLDEFFEKFYGPAAGPMKEYTMLLDRSLYNANHHSGCAWGLLHIYDDAVRDKARAAIRRAERLVGLRSGLMGRRLVGAGQVTGDNALYALRVEVASKGWRYFDEFAEMMESRRRHDFITAMAALERMRDLIDSLVQDYEYAMLPPETGFGSRRYLDIFYGNATEAGYKCLSGGGELIAGLGPVWDFMLEPQGIGERIGLYNPFYTGGNWQTIDIRHTWSKHGLHYYYGEAWYRQSVEIPASAAGRKVKLWFSGVDRGAKVWVNGKLLGTSPGADFDITSSGGATAQFEFDATDAIRPGKENLVVVRTIRDHCNEVGTGGLRDVAMFYAPGEQDEDQDSGE